MERALGLAILAALAVSAARAGKHSAPTPLQPGDDPDLAVRGKYELLGQAPIAAAHAMQLPCGSDQFLLMEFGPTGAEGKLMLPHPSENPDGTKVLWLWDRAAKKWTHIDIPINSICGGWSKLANGNVGMFAGHYQTLGYKQTFAMNRIVLFDATQQRTFVKANLTAQRWYPTALPLPNGHLWVPGGTWAQKPNGTWPKARGADIYTPYADAVRNVPLNAKLFDRSIGNWYMGSLVLPSGKVAVLNMNMAQVVDPWTGDSLAEAPELPDPVKDVVWEFPRMGPQVMLRAPIYKPGAPIRYELMAFGGSYMDAALRKDIDKCGPTTCNREAGELRPCSEYSVRIGLTVHPDGRHEFDPKWEVEKMPGPRCIFDGVLLPNGHVVLIGGQKRGIGDLTNATHYNGGNEPWNQPWIYSPDAPAGSRFSEPGALTKIARLYHAVAQLTSRGDILATGTSNAAFWESKDSAAFERTPLGVNEFRQEIYHPPYMFRPNRPGCAAPEPPAWVPYGGTFEMGFTFPDSPGEITGVVWTDPGGTTHNYAIQHRSQLLPFSVKSRTGRSGVLSISAPISSSHAPPGFYVVFLVAGDLYSDGKWVQVREAAPKPLAGTTAPDAKMVRALSADFERRGGSSTTVASRLVRLRRLLGLGDSSASAYKLAAGGGNAVIDTAAPAARGTGASGLHISLVPSKSAPARAVVKSPAARLEGGKSCSLTLWARGATSGQTLTVSVVPPGPGSTDKTAALAAQPLRLQSGRHCLFSPPTFRVPAAGDYEVVFEAELAPGAVFVDIDDVEVFCLP